MNRNGIRLVAATAAWLGIAASALTAQNTDAPLSIKQIGRAHV